MIKSIPRYLFALFISIASAVFIHFIIGFQFLVLLILYGMGCTPPFFIAGLAIIFNTLCFVFPIIGCAVYCSFLLNSKIKGCIFAFLTIIFFFGNFTLRYQKLMNQDWKSYSDLIDKGEYSYKNAFMNQYFPSIKGLCYDQAERNLKYMEEATNKNKSSLQ